MIKSMKRKLLNIPAAATVGFLAFTPAAHATSGLGTGGSFGAGTGTSGSDDSFSTIAQNIITSIKDLPGLLSGVAYMFGTLLGVLGILKIKDHVENPSQTPLKDGAIRLAAGGGLFALPIIYTAMTETIGTTGGVKAANLAAINLAVGTGD